jgi:hypothetical protein
LDLGVNRTAEHRGPRTSVPRTDPCVRNCRVAQPLLAFAPTEPTARSCACSRAGRGGATGRPAVADAAASPSVIGKPRFYERSASVAAITVAPSRHVSNQLGLALLPQQQLAAEPGREAVAPCRLDQKPGTAALPASVMSPRLTLVPLDDTTRPPARRHKRDRAIRPAGPHRSNSRGSADPHHVSSGIRCSWVHHSKVSGYTARRQVCCSCIRCRQVGCSHIRCYRIRCNRMECKRTDPLPIQRLSPGF